jgi:hypothetical protein
MEFIYEIENALPPEICEEIINRYKKDNRKSESKLDGNKIDTGIRKSSGLSISILDDWKDADDILKEVYSKGISQYSEYISRYTVPYLVEPLFNNLTDEGYCIQEQKSGEYYNWHFDVMRNDRKPRIFSCILYLNTLEEDQGGCTEFWCGKKVRPKQGKMVIFPSSWTFIHRGAEVKNGGIKYNITTWMN